MNDSKKRCDTIRLHVERPPATVWRGDWSGSGMAVGKPDGDSHRREVIVWTGVMQKCQKTDRCER